jgi:hypothetical protein
MIKVVRKGPKGSLRSNIGTRLFIDGNEITEIVSLEYTHILGKPDDLPTVRITMEIAADLEVTMDDSA